MNRTLKKHSPPLPLDPRAYQRGLACVHCGLCLPACPTYVETSNEADSPRGRIQLMLGLSDGRIQLTESVRHHLDLCLDCRGCETACPSGVIYHELIEDARHRIIKRAGANGRFIRWIFFHVLTRPRRLKLMLLPARVLQKLGIYRLLRAFGFFKLLPSRLRKMEQMLPSGGKLWPRRLPQRIRAIRNSESKTQKDVFFFEGCIGSVMFGQVNRQSVELLATCGVDVSVPRAQRCCGAIHHHNGAQREAQALARRNIDAFSACHSSGKPAMIVTNIAGCGAMLREYDLLLRDDPEYRDRAKAFAASVRDISEALLELGLPPMTHPIDLTITYHDACHLAHAQHVTQAPRALLAKIPGLKFALLPESDLCCGAAGTYNITEPEMASRLAERKLANIAATGASLCATGNVGCALHIQSQAAARRLAVRIVHPVQLLHQSLFGSQQEKF